MIVLFIMILFSPKRYHDIPAFRAGLMESKSIYEGDIYPTIQAIDYQGFVHE